MSEEVVRFVRLLRIGQSSVSKPLHADAGNSHNRALAPGEERSLLMSIYAVERQDDQTVSATRVSLLAATIALMSTLGFVLVGAAEAPGWVFVCLPLLPLPFFAVGGTPAPLHRRPRRSA